MTFQAINGFMLTDYQLANFDGDFSTLGRQVWASLYALTYDDTLVAL